jgi:hypothetical protein
MALWLRLAFQTAAAAALTAGGSVAIVASAPRPGYDRVLEDNLFYRIPDGFSGIQQPGGIFLYPLASLNDAEPSLIVLTREILVDPSLRRPESQAERAELATAIIAKVAGPLIEDPKPVVREELSPPPPRGAPLEVRSFSVASRNGRTLRVRMRARAMFDGVAFHLLLATRPGSGAPALLDSGYENLYGSLGFARLGDAAPRRTAPALATTLPEGRQSRPVAPSPDRRVSKAGRQCRIVQRQRCSGGIGTSLGYFCTTVPQRVCG